MRKKLTILISVVLSTMMFVGCSKPNSGNTGNSGSSDDKLSVALLIPGSLGDKSFFDAANNGLKLIESELGAETKVIEMGTDETKWEPALRDVSEGDWDVIISGNSASEILNNIADQYQDKKYINFDSAITEASSNIYSMSYKTNQVAFLAGALAGEVTKSDMPLANKENVIGFLGGMDIPGINDFLVAYIQGAQYVNSDIKVITSYAGNFTDPAKGKEISNAQYDSNVDISFNVAGGTGLGLIDSATEKDKYAIGVDSDQAMIYKSTDENKASHIISSAMKNIDKALLEAVKKFKDGSLKYGEVELLGIKENAVGLAKNEYYNALPENIKKELDEISTKISNGEIEVKSGFTMTAPEIEKYRNSVKP
ncbi:MAG: BMP family ABC transporter substrate-binding protein [Clostridium sp.]|uniref:BMP family ABC transporter substrate-binding protein n=1 Tax=Clostridium sp. TaxID=1506 RepID=UPI00304A52B5